VSQHRGRAVAVVIGAGVLFGTTGTASVLADTSASPTAIAAARMLVGSLGLVLVATLQRGVAPLVVLWRQRETWFMGIGVAGYMSTFFIAVHLGGVAIASLVSISLSPFFTSTIARMFGRPWPGRTWLISTLLAITGVVLLGMPSAGAGGDSRLAGALCAAIASASYGLYTVFGARFIDGEHHATDALAASFAIGTIILLPALVIDPHWLVTPRGILLALWLGIASTTTSYIMFGYGLTHLAPGVVATLVLSEPVVATLLGVGVLGEQMPMRGWFGCALIAIGLLLVARNESKSNTSVDGAAASLPATTVTPAATPGAPHA
jgi:DME family drug/metabolite transporter